MNGGKAIWLTRATTMQGMTALILAALFLVLPADASEQAEEPPVFSNQDLRQYSTKTSGEKTEERTVRKEKRHNGSDIERETKEQEFWCKKATPYRQTIEENGEELKETEGLLSQERARNLSRNKQIPVLERKAAGLKKKMKKAERKLGDLEDEAYRKGIPQGWLRCQFE